LQAGIRIRGFSLRFFNAKTRAGASRLVATAIGALVVACTPEAAGPGGSVETVLIAPPTATVSVGASLTLSAEVRDGDGSLLTGQRVSWSSENPTVAEVSQSGVVTGRKVGSVLIAASSWGKDAFARVTVNPTPVVVVRLSSTHESMQVGEHALLTADPLDGDGNVLANRPVAWSSSDPTVATTTQGGLVTAVGVGGAIITASAEGRSAVASITVSAVPVASVLLTPDVSTIVVAQTVQLSAQVRDASGAALTGRTIVWTTNSAQVATVTSQGLVTAIAPGNATITATSEGRSASAAITVNPRPVSAVILSPGQVNVFTGQSVQLNALVTDDRGQVLTGRPINYSSSNTAIATVSSAGLVTGVTPGTVTITATSESSNGTATVTVAPEPVASVSITPVSPSVIIGQTVQLTAIAKNASGTVLNGRTVSWSSGAPGLATVSSLGVVTGIATGMAVIIATIDGTQGSALVTVRLPPVASVTISPASTGTIVGQTVALSVTTRDAAGNVLTGRVVGWSSSDNTVATVSSAGVVTGISVGSATITATSEGQTGTATITVSLVPVASVSVTPSPANLMVGQTLQLSATPRDAGGTVLTGRTVTWTTGDAAVASVSSSGVVTAVSPGNTQVTATIDGVPGSVSTTVTAVPVANVVVSPNTATVVVGQNVTLSATALDANGNPLAGRVITWTTSNAGRATVSNTGVVTGVSTGNVTITASTGGKSGSAAVTVNAPPPVLTTIDVSPSAFSLDVGQTRALSATARDQFGQTMSGVTFTWSSNNGAVATVSSSGVATGVAAGNATISASAAGISGTSTVNVQPPPIHHIIVAPSSATINVGQTVQFSATAYDSQNNVIPGVTFTWSSSDANRVTVTSTGLAKGIKSGSATIKAAAGGKSATGTVTVK
jgi:uncharacterized protein YjdB